MGLFDRLRAALGLDGSEASSTGVDEGATAAERAASDDDSQTHVDGSRDAEDNDFESEDGSPTGGDDTSQTTADTPGPDPDAGAVTPDAAGGSTPTPPATFAHEATDLAEFWSEYPLDFSPESLRHLDSLVDEHWPTVDEDGEDEDEDGDDPDVQRGMVIQFGSYFGETLVHSEDAEWTELDPGGWAVTVQGDDGEATIDVFRVARDCLRDRGQFFETYRSVTAAI